MANRIQIKRSIANSVVTGLNPGELAFTANSNVIYIGHPDVANGQSIRIGGLQTPGTLTANQALVANSTSGINKVIVANLVPTSLYANGSFGSANQVLKSDGANVYWTDDVGDISEIIAGNGLDGGGTTGQITINVGAGDGIAVNADFVSVKAGTNGGLISNSDGVFVKAGVGIIVNANGVNIGQDLGVTANVQFNAIEVNDLNVTGNSTLGSNTSDVITVNALVTGNLIPTATSTYYIGNTSNKWLELNVGTVKATDGTFSGNVAITGDLVVTGNVTTLNVSSISVSDPLIKLASNNNLSDSLYMGFAAHYNGSGNTTNHTGLVRSPNDKEYYLFSTYGDETNLANNIINVNDPSFSLATLNAYLESSGLATNAAAVSITANSTVTVSIVANTLTLSSPLGATSGGTGTSTYAIGDILVGGPANALSKLTLGTGGYVLQSNGTALIYDFLDGGTF